MKILFRTSFLLLAASAFVGCNSPDLLVRLQDEDTLIRIPAIKEAGQTGVLQAIPYLVDMLDDEEGEVRLFSSEALREITGKSMGYHSYDTPAKRAVAQQQWREWVTQQGMMVRGPNDPADSSAGDKNE